MNPWSLHRKRVILSIVLGALIVVVGLPLFFFFYRSPSCSDGKQNGDESGIDCGGGCKLLCQANNLPIILKGDARVIKVASTTYALIIEAENPNVNADILNAQFTFKVYEASSTIPLKIVDGKNYVPKGDGFAVFVGPLDFGEGQPNRATFEWKPESLIWNKNISQIPNLIVQNKILTNIKTEPRFSAELLNQNLDKIKNIELTALIRDISGNTIAASKTFVDEINKGEISPIVFTWPAPFSATSTSVEILIRVFPDNSYL